jgi:hypothetical protein
MSASLRYEMMNYRSDGGHCHYHLEHPHSFRAAGFVQLTVLNKPCLPKAFIELRGVGMRRFILLHPAMISRRTLSALSLIAQNSQSCKTTSVSNSVLTVKSPL